MSSCSPAQTLRSIQDNLASLCRRHDEWATAEQNDELWMKVCYRLDIIALIVTNAINVQLFLVYAVNVF